MAALLVTGVAFDLILIPFCGAVGAAIFAYLAFFAGGARQSQDTRRAFATAFTSQFSGDATGS